MDSRTEQNFLIDPGLSPDQSVYNTQDGMTHVGGCDACPMSKWIEIDGRWKKSECKESSVFVMYVYTSYLTRAGVQWRTSPINVFRDRGADPSLFQEYTWDEFVVYQLTNKARESVELGSVYTGQGKQVTLNLNDALTPFIIPEGTDPKVVSWFTQYQGLPRHLIAFEVDGELLTVDEALASGVEPKFAGVWTLRLTSEIMINTRDAEITIPVIHLPTKDSPLIVYGSDEFNKWADARREAKSKSTLELIGWRTKLSDTSLLPAPTQHPQLESGFDENPYGIDIDLSDMEELL